MATIASFYAFAVGKGHIHAITKTAYHNFIMFEFRGTHANVITIDQWNQIGRITGTQDWATVDISTTNSGQLVDSEITFDNTNGTSAIVYLIIDMKY